VGVDGLLAVGPGWARRRAGRAERRRQEHADADGGRGLGLDTSQRAGTLSGRQRAQLSLTLAVAKRLDLLVPDEPVASLDPLARREFLQSLMEVVAERKVTAVLSSHLITDLERVRDYLVVPIGGRMALHGPVDDLMSAHRRLIGPRHDSGNLPDRWEVIDSSHVDRQSTLLLRTTEPILDPSWTVTPVTPIHRALAATCQEDLSTLGGELFGHGRADRSSGAKDNGVLSIQHGRDGHLCADSFLTASFTFATSGPAPVPS
jgi:ABC-type multidrug transport system ATPase subunit